MCFISSYNYLNCCNIFVDMIKILLDKTRSAASLDAALVKNTKTMYI